MLRVSKDIVHYSGSPKRLVVRLEGGAVMHEACDVAELDRIVGLAEAAHDDTDEFTFHEPDHPDD